MFSKKVHYGLRFILALSVLGSERVIGIAELAEREKLPVKFLEAIAVLLRKNGVVQVKRGAGGGYRLAKSLKEITLFDIVTILEEKQEKETPLNRNNSEIVVSKYESGIKIEYEQLLKSHKLDTLRTLYNAETDKIMFYI